SNQPKLAVEHYQEVLRLKMNEAEVHDNLGIALVQVDRLQDAVDQFKAALEIRPTYASAQNNLAVALADLGQAHEAIERLQNLTNSYIQANRPDDALATAQKALEIARSHGQTQLAQKIESWLARHKDELAHPAKAPRPSQP